MRKMKMKKRILSTLLAMCMLLTLLPVTAMATQVIEYGTCGAEGVNMDWMLYDTGLLYITGKGDMENWKGELNMSVAPWSDRTVPIQQVTIEEGVTNIGMRAFMDCTSLTSVEIPSTVKTIDKCAFAGCTGLTNIIIPEGVEVIGESAFRECSSLTSINIPNGVTRFGDLTFEDCTDLTSITIPDSLTDVGRGTFENCPSLTRIEVSEGNQNYTSQDGVLFTKDMKTLIAYPGGRQGSYTIPYGVENIGEVAFYGCAGLTDITIPDTVKSIGRYAFEKCSGLTSITIPDGVTNICDGTFVSCTGLTSVTIPNSVTGIGAFAFEECTGLNSITIPESVKMIDIRAFEKCTRLTSITIPAGVTVIDDNTFLECTGLTDVYYGGSEREWSAIQIADKGNEPLKNATIHYNPTVTPVDINDTVSTWTDANTGTNVNTGMGDNFGEQFTSGSLGFYDIPDGAYYYDAVVWAVERGVTSGTSANSFSPADPCTRAQIVTFLWRLSGSPKASARNPFTDVSVNSYYYDAVLWAVDQGITGGTSATTFGPNDICTRAQAVTFLRRAVGTVDGYITNSFSDVPDGAYYYDAVSWAVMYGITSGTSANTFSPADPCTRAQIATFLYRTFAR